MADKSLTCLFLVVSHSHIPYFPFPSGLQHTARGTPGCAFTACMVPPISDPTAFTQPWHSGTPFPLSLTLVCCQCPTARVPAWGLPLQCVMPWKNLQHLFPAKFLVEVFALHLPQQPVVAAGSVSVNRRSLRGGSGVFRGSGAAPAGAVSAESPELLPAPLAAAPAWPALAFPQSSEACQGMKHYPLPDVCS